MLEGGCKRDSWSRYANARLLGHLSTDFEVGISSPAWTGIAKNQVAGIALHDRRDRRRYPQQAFTQKRVECRRRTYVHIVVNDPAGVEGNTGRVDGVELVLNNRVRSGHENAPNRAVAYIVRHWNLNLSLLRAL